MKNFLANLKRRKVFTVAIAYAVVGWLLIQVAATILPIFDTPAWVLQVFTVLLFLGFPLAMVLAWAYELTPDGVVRDRAEPSGAAATGIPGDAAPALPKGPSITVLPFRNLSGDQDQDLFAQALTGDIVSGLTQTSSLFVIATAYDAAPAPENDDGLRTGRALGAGFVLQGSVNRIGDQLRVTAQLSDTNSGEQIWSNNYDKALSAANLFDVQDDIRVQIVSALGDLHGALYSSETRKSIRQPTDSLNAYQCLAVALAYDKYLSEENHLRARESLEHAVELDPDFDQAWAHLSWIYTDEYVYGFNALPEPIERALAAARRGVELNSADYHNRWLLSRVHYFNGERELFLVEAEKSLSLNANDGTTVGLLGCYLAVAGQWDRGRSLIANAMKLNPGHPDYYYWFLGLAELNDGDDAAALAQFRNGYMPEFPMSLVFLEASSALVGQTGQAKQYRRELEKIRPGVDLDWARDNLNRLLPYQPGLVKKIVTGLQY